MHRIDTSTAQRDKFGQGKNGFTRGNPQTGTPATQLDYLYCDAIQEEIANAIESAGIKLDKSKHDQLATAIKEFVKKGSVKFNSSTNSTSETEAATPKAVKAAYDLASNAVKKSGDEITGQLRFSPTSYGMKFLHENGNELVMRPSGDSFIYAFYNAESNTWQNKLRYVCPSNTWRFENVDDVTINNKSVLKTGDFGLGSSVGAIANNFDDHLDGGFYQCRTTDFTDLQLSGNSTATLLAYPSTTATWKVEQLSVVNSNEPRVYYRCDTKGGKQKWHEAVTTANIQNYSPQVTILYPGGNENSPALLQNNQRIVLDNPFRTMNCLAIIELLIENQWGACPLCDDVGGDTGRGATATIINGDKIIIQTGKNSILNKCFLDGNPWLIDRPSSQFPFRLRLIKLAN